MDDKTVNAHAEILDFIEKQKGFPFNQNVWLSGQKLDIRITTIDGKFKIDKIEISNRMNWDEEAISVFLESLRLADLL